MQDYRGVIIEESLDNKDVLKKVQILGTEISVVNEKHKTPWLKQWTLHTVIIPENEAETIAIEISKSFDQKHTSWYADYRNKTHHYIIFPNKIFYINRQSVEEYNKAKDYGLFLGIPSYQVDFHPEVKDNI
jgi:hypothetical protein